MSDIHDRQPMSKLRFCRIFTTTNSHMFEQKNIQILLRLCGSACKSEYASDMSKVFFAVQLHGLVCSKLKAPYSSKIDSLLSKKVSVD